jgi:two-component system, OmpR family, sensor histidine kinase KdpD
MAQRIPFQVLTSMRQARKEQRPAIAYFRYIVALLAIVVVSCVSKILPEGLNLANIVMVYLLGVVVVAVVAGRGPSIVASVLSVAALDFFFVHPYFTFAVSDTQYLITFAVMLVVALVISGLATMIHEQLEAARRREQRTAALFALSEKLSDASDNREIINIAIDEMKRVYDGGIEFIPHHDQLDVESSRSEMPNPTNLAQQATATEVTKSVKDGLSPQTPATLLPIRLGTKIEGVVSVLPREDGSGISKSQTETLQLIGQQLALALDRAALSTERQRMTVEIETERVRNALLSSVSHDLRTPLATIAGSASVLMDNPEAIDSTMVRSLAGSIFDESKRLNRIIENLVCATRIESGAVSVNREWVAVEEVVGTALRRLADRLCDRQVTAIIERDLPLIKADGLLLELVVVNIVENAVKYTPMASDIKIRASRQGAVIRVEIEDQGIGIPAELQKNVFQRFYQRASASESRGIGLGLYICEGIVRAHEGRIWADNVAGAGAVITFEIPAAEVPEFNFMEAR